MTDEECIRLFARQVVLDHLDDGIEFCEVYERDDVPTGFGDEELRKVHDIATAILTNLLDYYRTSP